MKRLKDLCSICLGVLLMAFVSLGYAQTMEQRTDRELRPALEASMPLDLERTGGLDNKARFQKLVGSADLPSDKAVKVYDVYAPGSAGDIRIRIYEPQNVSGSRPGVYWIHGGGFLFGVPEQDEAQSLRFAKEVGAVVAAVDYRLDKYPVPLQDAYAGLEWFAANADKFGVDKKRIAVAGASAGGNLCAAVTLMARDKGGPELALQMPLYPMIDDRFITPSAHEEFDSRVWNNTANAYAWKQYLGSIAGTDAVTAYMAPARAKDLKGLPPAYSCVGNLDPFRDDTIKYFARLIQSGIPAELHVYPGAYHAFEVIAPNTAYGKQAVDEYVRVLRKALSADER